MPGVGYDDPKQGAPDGAGVLDTAKPMCHRPGGSCRGQLHSLSRVKGRNLIRKTLSPRCGCAGLSSQHTAAEARGF